MRRIHPNIMFTAAVSASLLTAALPTSQAHAAPASGQSASDPSQYFPTDSRRWTRAGEAVLLTDLSQVAPASALVTDKRRKGKWKVIPYKTASFSGQSLSAYAYTDAPIVSLPLGVSGWHAVYIGVGTVSNGIQETGNIVRAKLSGREAFKRMSNHQRVRPANDRRDSIQEIFLDVADVTGQSVQIAQAPFKPAAVMYVKLVPLTQEEVAHWQSSTDDPAARPLIATFDGHSWIWPYRPRTAAHLKETFEGFQHTDFKKWWFQVMGADLVCYPSKVGTLPGIDTEDFPRWEYEEFVTSLKALIANGVNPLKVARQAAREQGAEFHIFIRPGAWQGSISLEETFNSRFFAEHPEWRCIDRDGTPTLYMSYAVPQVRQHILDVLREALLMVEPEGVGFLFNRGMPMILWEDAFCQRFASRYGQDARQVPENDPRILVMRAQIMTELMQELRAMLDQVQRQQGRQTPYRISLATFSKERDNQLFGIDLENWIKIGLVDDVAVAYFAHHTSFSEPGGSFPDMAYYQRITQGTGVGLYPFVISWNPGTPAEMSKRVVDYYKHGATGIAVWDPSVEAGWRSGEPGNVFDALSRLGHVDDVQRWAEKSLPKPLVIPLTRYGDNHYSRWFPNTGF